MQIENQQTNGIGNRAIFLEIAPDRDKATERSEREILNEYQKE